ncbi:hypothetical protein AAFF_G00406690 [Aldrovandia affinis]|uniref:protein-tyrosine-phosphatase n=1 Tax=Aldrovandia affinis TaxID=143900 RepID=A0AAD7SCA0_9TELE|nr:hypothetical protein AAFF_G00406690 [Aldrovandia affinis]
MTTLIYSTKSGLQTMLLLLCLCVAQVWPTTESTSSAPATTRARPENVNGVKVTMRTETELELQWDKVSDDPSYSYTLEYRNGNKIDDIFWTADGPVKYNVSGLAPGTKYDFTLFTVFETVRSSGCNFSAITRPANVHSVNVTMRTETELELQWNEVSNDPSYNYTLEYRDGNKIDDIFGTADGLVKYNVSGLAPGTKYDFTLFTVFENVTSSGHNFSNVTRPANVHSVNVTMRTETELELQWHKVPVDPSYSYRLEYRNGNKIDDIFGTADGPVKYNVSGLAPGTKYDFTLFTVFENVTSSGHNFSTVTRPANVHSVNVTMRTEIELELQWHKVPVDPSYSYRLEYRNGNKIDDIFGTADGPVKYNVSGLAPGTKYDFTLFTVFENVTSGGHNFSTVTSSSYNMSLLLHLNSETVKQCDHTLTLVPPQVTGLHCDYVARGYGFSLSWEPPQGVWTQVEVKISGRNPHNATGTEMGTVILGVKPAQTYHMTVTSVSGTMRSASVTFQCETDPRGVIAGSVMAVLLLAVVAFLIVFILRRKPELLSPKFFMESKIASDKFKAIPKGQFEAHFNKMSCDQNRGFSEEYEDLSTVGKEQTCKAALISENNDKNRFSDVLPYDWSRVKLPTINNDYSSDYINACYVPGYGNNSRQYIAAQGPLPHTVNDFWRMCWEQRVHSIVMVTNCCEGGKVKCEQYWPLDYTPCVYGDILVRVSSENKVSNWTLREFEVTNRVTSSVRSVKHFHFTAWPDHGVPGGTSALIQFRGLIRQHIESCGSVGPTLVHCSAGVGRTGTLIALDVTLQQLEREKAVGLAAFVYKMRLSRPLMVQTESQYVFLHQCIMDSLRPKLEETQEEPLYENVSTIYVNATALRELNSANTNA